MDMEPSCSRHYHGKEEKRKKKRHESKDYRPKHNVIVDDCGDGNDDGKKQQPLTDAELYDIEQAMTEERRLQRKLKKAKKIAKHLEELGHLLDEDGNELDQYSRAKYPVREYKLRFFGMRDSVAVNPVVALLAVLVFWGMVVWCTVDTANALLKLDEWRTSISLHFTWLFHGSKVIFLAFMLYIAYKYGSIHLGTKEERPEFSTLTYSSMIYTVGVGNALIAYSASEPLSHRSDHYFVQTGYRSQDEIDMFAINLTVTDWGFGCWVFLTMVAVAMSLAAYRFRLPMTFRSCFYPMLGSYTWGWMGDIIDATAIIAALAVIFTSLGLAVSNTMAGLAYMGWIDADGTSDQTMAIQNVIIWVMTIVTLISVVSGLHGGTRIMCIVAMGLACLLVFAVFAMEDSKFLLNLQVQEVGSYLQSSIFQLNFWTDAFGQLREGSGRAVDGKAAEQWWFTYWFNFGVSWWATASPVNGLFIASISRGRSLREVILHSLVVPVAYGLVWFCVWGGIGLRQLRQAMELEILGETHFNNSAHFSVDGSEFCYHVPQHDLVVDDVIVFTNHIPGVTPVCKYDSENGDSALYNILNSFSFPDTFRNGDGNGSGSGSGGYGPALSMLSLLVGATLFMACAGAASQIVDKMASSGRKNNHLARRMFWLVTVGALTTALLSKGGQDALNAVQAAMLICGLPCTIMVCYMLQSVTLLCQQAAAAQNNGDYQFPKQPEFPMPVFGGIFNVVEYVFSNGKVDPSRLEQGMGNATSEQVSEFVKGLVVPSFAMKQILSATYPENKRTNAMFLGAYTLCYYGWIILSFATFRMPGLAGPAWLGFVLHTGLLALIRSNFRARHNLRSNPIADVTASALLWPQVLTQMSLYTFEGKSKIEQPIAQE